MANEHTGDTVKVADYVYRLASGINPYTVQFEEFYDSPRTFSRAECTILAEKLVAILKRAIDNRAIAGGIEIFDPEILSILRSNNLLLPKSGSDSLDTVMLPGNYVIPLYDLIMSKTHSIGRLTVPLPPDILYRGEEVVPDYINAILLETDRYQSAIELGLKDCIITFFPGRIWVVVKRLLDPEVSLDISLGNLIEILAGFHIREMTPNEKLSKFGYPEHRENETFIEAVAQVEA
jgi:hypothetical protein